MYPSPTINAINIKKCMFVVSKCKCNIRHGGIINYLFLRYNRVSLMRHKDVFMVDRIAYPVFANHLSDTNFIWTANILKD